MHPDALYALCSRLIAYLETGEPGAGLFTEDVLLDLSMPQWRIQARGLADVLAVRRNGHPQPGRVPHWRALPTPEGFVMEFEENWRDAGDDWYCREALVAQVRGNSISRIAVYCTGDWSSARVAAHRAEVRLIEPRAASGVVAARQAEAA